MMNLVIAILTILGIPVSITLLMFQYRIRCRTWNSHGLCAATWLLVSAIIISVGLGLIAFGQFLHYSVIEEFSKTPHSWYNSVLLWVVFIYVIVIISGIVVYASEKDRDNIVFWPSQR